MSESDNKEIEEIIAQAKKVIADNSNSPKDWSKKSTAAYYKPAYAAELITFLAQLEANPAQDLFFRSARFKRSPKTLVDRFSQAFMYIIKYLDTPDKKYAKLRLMVEIRKNKTGASIGFKDRSQILKLEPELIGATNRSGRIWREQLEDWIDKAVDGDKFERTEGIVLSEDDMKWVRESLAGMENSYHIIKLEEGHIKIIRQEFKDS